MTMDRSLADRSLADRSLADRIRAEFGKLPAKQRVVARLLTDEPAFLALASLEELAGRAGVDAATVVRTCQSLGYSGWRELRLHVKASVGRQRTFAERVAALEPEDHDFMARIHETARRNVDETFRTLDQAAFEHAVGALSRAGTVVVAAGGVSSGVGEFFTSSLQIIGVRALHATGISDGATALAPLGAGDVVVGISMWRYLTSTVKMLEYAKETIGATTIAVTDSTVSPAAQLADCTLVAHTTSVGPRMGMTGLTALVEALVTGTALLDAVRSQAAAAAVSGMYFDGHVLGEPAPPGNRESWSNTLIRETNGE